MLLGSKWRHWWRKDKTAGEKQTWRWGEERTENKGGERGFEMSQNSFTRSLNSLQRCVVYLSPPFLCSQSGLNSPEMFWSSQNHSLTIAVLCHPTALSSVWVDTLLREKQTEGGRLREHVGRVHLVSFSRLSCGDQVNLACRICNEPLLFVTDIPPRPPHCLHLFSRTECEGDGQEGERQSLQRGGEKEFFFDFPALTSIQFESTNVRFFSFCFLWHWHCFFCI